MTIKIKRLFHGFASVRDYQTKQAIENNEDLIITMGDQSMRVPHEEIRNGRINAEVFQSIHEKNLKYHLVDFVWKPSVDQETLI